MAHPNEISYRDLNPFEGMIIEEDTILSELEGRAPCPKCNKSRKYYCYSCFVPIAELTGKIPYVKLPIKIDIIKHKHEIDGKSTSGHAAVLAPDDVKVYTYPHIPDYTKEKVVLVFPSSNAITIPDLLKHDDYQDLLNFKRQPLEDIPEGYNRSTLLKKINTNQEVKFEIVDKLPIEKVVFIDSTWNQSKSIFKDPIINKIPCIVISNRISQFWRHQKGSPRWYLATIEAIHQFLIEVHLHKWGLDKDYKGIYNCFSENTFTNLENLYNLNENAYRGQYDNLLFFFKHMYGLIHTYYDHKDLYAYKRRMM